MKPTSTETRLREQLLLARAVPGDRLMLADATLLAALDGSRALTPNESLALQGSPLTLRRFRHLALERRADAQAQAPAAANDAQWHGSAGMLRAAASGSAAGPIATDDGCWRLHLLEQGQGWQLVLQLAADAPFAAALLRAQPLLRVRDGAGTLLLQGRLDADGELEGAWPLAAAPVQHLRQCGGAFAVEPVAP